MATGDAKDFEITFDNVFPIIWAESKRTAKLEYHSAKGIVKTRIVKPKEVLVEDADGNIRVSTGPTLATPDGQDFTISYDKDKKMLKMVCNVKKGKYLGVGLGCKGMKDCDMIMF